MEQEIWRNVVDYDYLPIDGYEVSNNCQVRSINRYVKHSEGHLALKRGKTLKQFTKKGTQYKRVKLSVNGKTKKYYVHTLVALAFPEICGKYKPGLTIDHKNGLKNDNRPENLKFCTILENIHNPSTFEKLISASKENIKKTRTRECIEKMKRTKSKKVVCIETGQMFDSRFDAANSTNSNPDSIWQCCAGKKKSTSNGLHWKFV